MKKRFVWRYLALFLLLIGVVLVGASYQRAARQAKLDSALSRAVFEVDAPAVISLLNRGADPNTRYQREKELNFLDFIKRLFTPRQKVRSQGGATPSMLQMAIHDAYVGVYHPPDKEVSDYDAIGEALVMAGADSHVSIDGSKTPLEEAAANGMPRTVLRLLQGGENPNARDKNGSYPLIGADAQCTQILLQQGAAPNVKHQEGWTPLHVAATKRNEGSTIIAFLLAGGANPNPKDKDGCTPLMYAGDPESAKLLIQYGADVNATDNKGLNVCAHARKNAVSYSAEEHKELMGMLKQHGAKE